MSSRRAQRQQLRQQREAAQKARDRAALRRRRFWQLGALVLLAGVVVAVAIAVSSGGSGSSSSGPPVGAAQVSQQLAGIPQRGITLGSPSAPVTMVEFGDLKCPVCRAYNQAVQPTLIDRYVRTGKLQIQFRNLAFVGEQLNPGDSQAAARMATAVGLQNHFWDFSDLFYLNQQDESTRYVTDAYVTRLAAAIPGVDVGQALAQRNSPEVSAQLAQANQQFFQNGFSGTPSFLFGKTGQPGKPFTPTSLDPSQFTAQIDRLLAP